MTKTRLTALLAVFLVAIAALVVAGCGSSDDDTTSASGGSEGGGETLTVGSDIPYPPFEEGKAPNYKGFDIGLMEAIGENIGREVEFQDTSFDTIFRDLAQGRFDAVASASTITDEREKSVDFTNPYYLSEQAILVEEGSDIVSLEDLAGTKVAVQQGTTGEEYSEANAEADEVRTYPSGPDAVNALKSGVVDAVMIDIPVAENAVKAGGGIEISAAIPTEEEYGFAVGQGETELLEELNEGLAQAIEDGTYATLYEEWFHHEPPAAIESATHEAS
ncbi:MAG TPA: transporter substrate-binding domain-containing protein [Solirubrobacterales bacterium]|nr:transporter substrate-binding domain-containing protein [Solirubrobacterales bacterium]